MKYYYVDITDNSAIKTATNIEDFVLLLYYGDAKFIDNDQVKKLGLDDDYISKLRIEISKHKTRLPLYDIRSNHIFLIHRDNIYNDIFMNSYRFVDKKFLSDLLSLKNPNKNDLDNIRILSNYDMKTLKKYSFKLFYNSFVINTYITNCKKPSFYPGSNHLSPYYNIDELNYLAYDWGLTDSITYDQKKLEIICEKISKYDIPFETLIAHQMYIYDTKSFGLVKYYSLYGSYFINKYLRYTECCVRGKCAKKITRNEYIENQAKIMINMIRNAPGFTKNHTVYRFINNDSHISHLEIGDIYKDNSFTSTTRNPFYCKDSYKFGYILIKIKLPKDIPGIGICIESYSNFPKEEEIILMPATRYRVENIIDTTDKKISKYESDKFHQQFDLEVRKKYEFSWDGNDYFDNNKVELYFDTDSTAIPSIPEINLPDIIKSGINKLETISDKIDHFRVNYTNINNQFITIVSNHKYTFVMESYDSTSAYLPFFFYELKNGVMLTTSNPIKGNINLMIEIGDELHVNYYFKYSVTDSSSVVDLDNPNWMDWLSMMAYIFGCRNIVIHSNYQLLQTKGDKLEVKIQKTKNTFPENIYKYMKHGIKMYDFRYVTPQFDYPNIDKLKFQPVSDTIHKSDRTELYRISRETKIENMYDFYIYIVESYPNFIPDVNNALRSVYDSNVNPFIHMNYKLDGWHWLYHRDIIDRLPLISDTNIRKGSFKKIISDKKIPKFKNRLRNLIQDIDG